MLQTVQTNDYELVRRTIEFVSENWIDHPSLDEIAGNVGASPDSVQRSFSRWAGLTPKSFMQASTVDRARQLLQDSATVMDTAYEVHALILHLLLNIIIQLYPEALCLKCP